MSLQLPSLVVLGPSNRYKIHENRRAPIRGRGRPDAFFAENSRRDQTQSRRWPAPTLTWYLFFLLIPLAIFISAYAQRRLRSRQYVFELANYSWC